MIALRTLASEKRKAGRLHPAKSSQDPHSVEPLRVINRRQILGELLADYQRFGSSLTEGISLRSVTYKTILVLFVRNYRPLTSP